MYRLIAATALACFSLAAASGDTARAAALQTRANSARRPAASGASRGIAGDSDINDWPEF